MHTHGMGQVRIGLSPYMEQLVKESVDLSGQTKTATIERLLFVVESLARHGKLPEAFGLDIIEAAAVINARGLGAKHLDPVHIGGGERIAFDERLLERSNKTKTGYAGVSATGSSFRALVPDVEMGGGTRYLPSRPTALRAAIDRYEWFQKHNIPYGNLGWHVNDLKTKHPEWSDQQCLEYLHAMFSGNAFGLKNPVSLDEIERALERYADRDTKPANEPESRQELIHAQATAEPPASRLASVPDVVRCALCKEAIDDGEPFGPYGKADYAHVACLS